MKELLAGLDFKEFANAILFLLTTIVVTTATVIGRRSKGDPVETDKPAAEVKMAGAAIVSSESVQALAGAVEEVNYRALQYKPLVEKGITALEDVGEKLGALERRLQEVQMEMIRGQGHR